MNFEERNKVVDGLPIESFIKLLSIHYNKEIVRTKERMEETVKDGLDEINRSDRYWKLVAIERLRRDYDTQLGILNKYETLESVIDNLITKYKLNEDTKHSDEYLKSL